MRLSTTWVRTMKFTQPDTLAHAQRGLRGVRALLSMRQPHWGLLVLSLAACTNDATVSAPTEAPSRAVVEARGTERLKTWDDLLESVAKAEPAFAGFVDGTNGRMAIAVVAGGGSEAARTRVATVLATEGARLPVDGAPFRTVDFSALDLIRVKKFMHRGFVLPGMVYLDLDEERNRVFVGVRHGANTAPVRQLIASMPKALQRMIVVDSGVVYEELQTSLRSYFQPVPGGVEIGVGEGTTVNQCTLGFNARTLTGQLVAVTADHCTTMNGWATGNLIRQNIFGPTRLIAQEIEVSPRYYPLDQPDDPCVTTYFCRFADAAAFAYLGALDGTPEVGFLARPFFQSINIDPNTPRFSLSGTAGATEWISQVDRIGRTTGWSTGSIYRRCTTWQNSNGVINICQYEANITVEGGDSGGPVFLNNGNGTGRVEGVVVARYRAGFLGSGGWKMVYSRFSSMNFPLGPLTVTP
jgi:hypothetical protein